MPIIGHCLIGASLISKANGGIKEDYAFRMNVMEEILEIRNCIEQNIIFNIFH